MDFSRYLANAVMLVIFGLIALLYGMNGAAAPDVAVLGSLMLSALLTAFGFNVMRELQDAVPTLGYRRRLAVQLAAACFFAFASLLVGGILLYRLATPEAFEAVTADAYIYLSWLCIVAFAGYHLAVMNQSSSPAVSHGLSS